MAESRQVTCINTSDRKSAHERIRRIGGRGWTMSQDEAIQEIESGRISFYVSVGGRTVAVVVAKSQYGNKYLKTEADGDQPDNLLSLPECP